MDGTRIKGHDAVAAWFAREHRLAEEYGKMITFQLYRANLAASTRTDVQGPRLAELRIDGDEVSGTDTVAMVKERILPALLGDQRAAPYVTFVFDNRVMHDDALFYADHPMLLPSWVQVLLSEAPFADFIAALGRLPK